MLELIILAATSANLSGLATIVQNPAVSAQAIREVANAEFLAKHYPQRALKAGEQGQVGFRLTVAPDGSLADCEVTISSGFKALDAETCEIMVTYARLKPVRDGEGRGIRSTSDGMINWKLPAKAIAAGTKPRVADQKYAQDMDKIICKKSVTTGSLVAKTRQCMTRRQWDRMADEYQTAGRRFQGVGYAEDDQ